MISVAQAIQLIEKNTPSLLTEFVSLESLTGRTNAEKITAQISLPPFDQSAMDGYAICISSDTTYYKIIGELPAGSSNHYELKEGEGVRVFTGAKVPDNANAVVMQEHCEKIGNKLIIHEKVTPGMNIRKKGYHLHRGETALKENTKINCFAIGYLSSLGLEKIKVLKHPEISIIATGSELIKPGNILTEGKIYESNSFLLKSAVKQYTQIDAKIHHIDDDEKRTEEKIKSTLDVSDILIISGGISVGDYDFVKPALNKMDVKEIFHKVNQKPGKPLFFGTLNNKLIFALPGNPSAAITSFLIYVLPAIRKISENKFFGLEKKMMKLKCDYTKKDNRAHFLKAYFENDKVEILDGQNSDILKSYLDANCIAFVPQDISQLKTNDSVEIHLL